MSIFIYKLYVYHNEDILNTNMFKKLNYALNTNLHRCGSTTQIEGVDLGGCIIQYVICIYLHERIYKNCFKIMQLLWIFYGEGSIAYGLFPYQIIFRHAPTFS